MRVSLLALFLGLLAVVSGQLDENEDMDKGIPENVQVKVAAADGAVVVGHAADANAAASGAGAVATNATASTGVVKFKCALCKLYFDLFKSQDSEVAKKEACNTFSSALERHACKNFWSRNGRVMMQESGGTAEHACSVIKFCESAGGHYAGYKYSGAVMASKPQLYWRMNALAGDKEVRDYSPYWNNGFVAGTADIKWQQPGLLVNDWNQAALFDGTGGYVRGHHLPSLRAKRFSFEAWLRVDNVSGTRTIAEKWEVDERTDKGKENGPVIAHHRGFRMQLVDSKIRVQIADHEVDKGATCKYPTVQSAAVKTNTTLHVVATFDGHALTLYVDAAEYRTTEMQLAQSVSNAVHDATRTLRPLWRNEAELHVGAHSATAGGNATEPFVGIVDEVAFYLHPLLKSDVALHAAFGRDTARPAVGKTRDGEAVLKLTGGKASVDAATKGERYDVDKVVTVLSSAPPLSGSTKRGLDQMVDGASCAPVSSEPTYFQARVAAPNVTINFTFLHSLSPLVTRIRVAPYCRPDFASNFRIDVREGDDSFFTTLTAGEHGFANGKSFANCATEDFHVAARVKEVRLTLTGGYATEEHKGEMNQLFNSIEFFIHEEAGKVVVKEEEEKKEEDEAKPVSLVSVGTTVLGGLDERFTSCADVKAKLGPKAHSGKYYIHPSTANPHALITAFCDMTTDGGGWTLVRRAGDGGFHPATDQLQGYDAYIEGESTSMTPSSAGSWSVPFANWTFSEYRIALGDESRWMVLERKAYVSAWTSADADGQCGQPLLVSRTQSEASPLYLLACMRSGYAADPILSGSCNQVAEFNGFPMCDAAGSEVLYGEGGRLPHVDHSKAPIGAMMAHGGSNVWIR